MAVASRSLWLHGWLVRGLRKGSERACTTSAASAGSVSVAAIATSAASFAAAAEKLSQNMKYASEKTPEAGLSEKKIPAPRLQDNLFMCLDRTGSKLSPAGEVEVKLRGRGGSLGRTLGSRKAAAADGGTADGAGGSNDGAGAEGVGGVSHSFSPFEGAMEPVVDKSGRLSVEELLAATTQTPLKCEKSERARIEYLLPQFDKSGSGTLNQDEFKSLVAYLECGHAVSEEIDSAWHLVAKLKEENTSLRGSGARLAATLAAPAELSSVAELQLKLKRSEEQTKELQPALAVEQQRHMEAQPLKEIDVGEWPPDGAALATEVLGSTDVAVQLAKSAAREAAEEQRGTAAAANDDAAGETWSAAGWLNSLELERILADALLLPAASILAPHSAACRSKGEHAFIKVRPRLLRFLAPPTTPLLLPPHSSHASPYRHRPSSISRRSSARS